MKRKHSRGISTFEFAMSLMVLVPLVLGTGAIGINLIRTMQTVQLARDAGHMYAKGVDFSTTTGAGNRTILANLGTGLGLSATTGQGRSVVILSALTYVDANTCSAGNIDNGGSGAVTTCANLGKWVFVQRLVIGNNTLRTSNYGAPITNGSDIPNNVTVDPVSGLIRIGQYTTRTGAVAQFTSASGINPYTVTGGVVSGLPSGQRLYLAEAAGPGYGMPPFVAGAPTYSYAFF